MDVYKNGVLKKAAQISGLVKSVTIGANSINGSPTDAINGSALEDCRSSIKANLKDTSDDYSSKNDKDIYESIQTIVIKNIEDQRQLKVKEAIKSRLQRILHENEFHHAQVKYRLLVEKQEIEEQKRNTERLILRELEEQEIRAREQQAQLEQQWAQKKYERNQKIREVEERERRIEEERRKKLIEQKEILDSIYECQHQCGNIYQQILTSAKTCKEKEALANTFTTQSANLRTLNEEMEKLVRHCKVHEVFPKDLEKAKHIVRQIELIQQQIQKEVGLINTKHDKELELAAAKQKRDSEIAAEKERSRNVSNISPQSLSLDSSNGPSVSNIQSAELTNFIDREAFRVFTALQNYLQEFEKSVEAISNDERLKKFRTECKKAVNTPVNAISAVSSAHLNDKYVRLSGLLSGQVVVIGNSRFRASDHPQGVAYCKSLLAKQFVCQSEKMVDSKPEAAFSLAAVIVALWVEFPDFGNLVLACFYKECPYLVPLFMPLIKGQSKEDYYRTLGYRYTKSGEPESQAMFLKRMIGVAQLYTAVLVTSLKRQHRSQPHPHGLNHAWQWFSRLLNLEPNPGICDVCADVLLTFLEVTGSVMLSTYGQQFQKLLSVIAQNYYRKLQQISASSSSASLSRLHTFLQEKLAKQGKIPPPAGLLPSNFW